MNEPARHQPRKVFTAERKSSNRPQPVANVPVPAPTPHADTPAPDSSGLAEILAAITRLESKLTKTVEIAPEIDKMQVEISEIAGRIKATKVEMAALRHPLEEENRFRRAADDLGDIVRATEQATTSIIEHAERIDEIASEMQTATSDVYMTQRLGQINDTIMQIYEACNFQDLTGQKIRKVVNTLTFVEERIEKMVAMWNAAELATLPMGPSLERADGDVVLHGPDLSGVASQSDIDALFD